MKETDFINRKNNIYLLVAISFIFINAGIILYRINGIILFISILGIIFMIYTSIQTLLLGRKVINEVDNKIV